MTQAYIIKTCCCSVAKSCLTLCDPMDCRMPGFTISVSQNLLKLRSIELVMLSNYLILCHPLLLLASVLPSFRVFSSDHLFASGGLSIRASASASVLPMNVHGWFPLGWLVWSPCCPRESSSPASQFKSINSSGLSFLYDPTLTSIHDYWKNHSFD